MGLVWEAYHKGFPLLGVPENPTDRFIDPCTAKTSGNTLGLWPSRLGLDRLILTSCISDFLSTELRKTETPEAFQLRTFRGYVCVILHVVVSFVAKHVKHQEKQNQATIYNSFDLYLCALQFFARQVENTNIKNIQTYVIGDLERI